MTKNQDTNMNTNINTNKNSTMSSINGSEPSKMPTGKLRLLVVDDERVITMHLKELLTNFGYEVVDVASNGAEALEKARKLLPDIILMDIIMPGNMTGIDAANEIKSRFGIPIIFLTAFGEDALVEKTKICEPYGYILKPFKNSELKAAIELASYKIEIEKKLKESEEKYRTVAEESRDGIGIIQNGLFKYVNSALFTMLGKPEDIYKQPYYHYFLDFNKDQNDQLLDKIICDHGTTALIEFKLKCQDGIVLPVEANGTKIVYNGSPAILFFFRSIAQRKYLEGLLDHHVNEINEHNQIIISIIEKLLVTNDQAYLEEQYKEILSKSFENANSINKLYKLLQLDHEKINLQPINLIDNLNDAIALITQQYPQKNIKVNTNIEGMIPKIFGDEFFVDVFQSLLESSVNNTDGNEIFIEASVEPFNLKDKKFIDIKFKDNSKGISDNDKLNLFKFYNLYNYSNVKTLNLTYVKLILNRYLGEIRVQDRIAGDHTKGCIYNIRLPAV